MIHAAFKPYVLHFKKPFTISHGTRKHTDTVLIRLSKGTEHGYGECTLPPYLKETTSSVLSFLNSCQPALASADPENDIVSPINAIHSLDEAHSSAKAGVEMALWDLFGKLKKQSTASLMGKGNKKPLCTYTIGVSSEEEILNSIKDAEEFKILKIKLNGVNDIERIRFIKKHSGGKRIMVDVNGGWKDRETSLKTSLLLFEEGIDLIEQPFPRSEYENNRWLTERSPIPVIGDESIQDLDHLVQYADCFSGINIKLMKCGGLLKAQELMTEAEKRNKKILLGCMSESTCGVAAANQLSSHADWVDLDGPMLIANDPFTGVHYLNGKLECSGLTGNGVECKLEEEFWK
jgi:L-Ala-D/L-Glu epimerase